MGQRTGRVGQGVPPAGAGGRHATSGYGVAAEQGQSDGRWPACTLEQATARLTAPGARFEMAEVVIRGVATRTWRYALPSLPALLAGAAVSHGSRTFLIHEAERVSHGGHRNAVARLAAALRVRGVGRGDRVAIAMRNRPEWIASFFAVTALGGIAVPLNAWWTGGELAEVIADCGATVLIADAERHARLSGSDAPLPSLCTRIVAGGPAVRSDAAEPLETLIGAPGSWDVLPAAPLPDVGIAPDDDAAIFYTSGTTGRPKGAIASHRNLLTNIVSGQFATARQALRRGAVPPDPQPSRTVLLPIPLFHVTGCSAFLLGSIAAGDTLVLMRRWNAEEALRLIARHRVQVTGGVPAVACDLLDHDGLADHDLSSLELVRYGGAPAPPVLPDRIVRALGAMPANGWGMTETCATVTSHAAEDYLARPTSCGPPVAVADLRVTGPDGADLPPGEMGELWARGPMVVRGYWQRTEETAATFVDGWVRTGDLAFLDDEGFCHIVDRIKDVVIRGGENIHAAEVEGVLHAHPDVAEAALLGMPHPILGEQPAAAVRLRPGSALDAGTLRDWLGERLAAYKLPAAFRFEDRPLPRNAAGKLRKDVMRRWFVPSQP